MIPFRNAVTRIVEEAATAIGQGSVADECFSDESIVWLDGDGLCRLDIVGDGKANVRNRVQRCRDRRWHHSGRDSDFRSLGADRHHGCRHNDALVKRCRDSLGCRESDRDSQ